MARSLNEVVIIGHLGGDPEIRTLGNGGRVVLLGEKSEGVVGAREGEISVGKEIGDECDEALAERGDLHSRPNPGKRGCRASS